MSLLRANCTRTRQEQQPLSAAGLLVPLSLRYTVRRPWVILRSMVSDAGSYASVPQTKAIRANLFDGAEAGQRVLPVDVHGARAADSLAA